MIPFRNKKWPSWKIYSERVLRRRPSICWEHRTTPVLWSTWSCHRWPVTISVPVCRVSSRYDNSFLICHSQFRLCAAVHSFLPQKWRQSIYCDNQFPSATIRSLYTSATLPFSLCLPRRCILWASAQRGWSWTLQFNFPDSQWYNWNMTVQPVEHWMHYYTVNSQ